MSSHKNYNSIVFLTTLSLYLGLVLAGGATPTVLAQAATTRNFDIKSEIVVEDDLDKKPDDKEPGDLDLDSYYNNVEKFFGNLKRLHEIEKFALNYDSFEVSELGFVPCNVDGDPVRVSTVIQRIDNLWLEPVITDATYSFNGWKFLSDCLKDERFKTGISQGIDLKFVYDKSELKVEISAFKSSPRRAEQLVERFNQAHKIYELDDEAIVIKKIHENTSYKAENNQVFIVTRLPRASIDDLLAKK